MQGSWKKYFCSRIYSGITGTPLSLCARMAMPNTPTHHTDEILGCFTPVFQTAHFGTLKMHAPSRLTKEGRHSSRKKNGGWQIVVLLLNK